VEKYIHLDFAPEKKGEVPEPRSYKRGSDNFEMLSPGGREEEPAPMAQCVRSDRKGSRHIARTGVRRHVAALRSVQKRAGEECAGCTNSTEREKEKKKTEEKKEE